MNILPLTLFEQEHNDCGIASISAISNYYDSKINYSKVKNLAFKLDPSIEHRGTYSGQLGIILNKLGFRKVTIYSSNHDVVDFSWNNLSHEEIRSNLKEISIYGKSKDFREDSFWYHKFLSKRSYENRLIVSSDFVKIIKKSIDNYKPLLIDYNWSQMFNHVKSNSKDEPDYIRGDVDYHAVTIVGYNKEKVCILDSNNNVKKREKIEPVSSGCYYVRWEHLMVAMGKSDLIVPEKYVKK